MKKLFWKNWIVLLLGFVVLLLPFMGFPTKVSNWIYVICGFLIVVISYVVGRGLSYAYSAPAESPVQQADQLPRKPINRTPRKKNIEPVSVREAISEGSASDYVATDEDAIVTKEEPFNDANDSKAEDHLTENVG